MNRKQMKTCVMLCLSAMLTACMPPEANTEHAMWWLLNGEEGRNLTADELANIDASTRWWDKIRGAEGPDIHLPVTDVDVLPHDGVAYVAASGDTAFVFTLTSETDTLGTVGTVQTDWASLLDSSKECQVQARGKSIYTLYQPKEDGSLEWAPLIIYVYPSADSLLVTYGYGEPSVCRVAKE